MVDGRLVIQERNGSDTPLVAYTRGTDLSATLEGAGGISGMLARSHGYSAGSWSTHHAYHADSVGNISALVSTAQTVSASYRYDPFGRTIALCGTMAGQNTYRFSSKMFTGGDLYYYGYRFYDPNYQRWLNQDPIGENGGINLYRAFGNAPTLLIDAFGLACETPWDAANLLMGIGSFAANASSGNVMGAFVDAGGIILDAGATAMPGAPGGAATLIKAGRAADKVNDWAKTGNKGRKVSEIPNRWKPGDDVYNPTRNGHPSEQTVRRREWMNEAQNPNRDDYTPTDFDRMKKGKPPERINPRTGERESMERSHEPVPKRDGGKQTQPRWPDEHGAVDPCRRLKK